MLMIFNSQILFYNIDHFAFLYRLCHYLNSIKRIWLKDVPYMYLYLIDSVTLFSLKAATSICFEIWGLWIRSQKFSIPSQKKIFKKNFPIFRKNSDFPTKKVVNS